MGFEESIILIASVFIVLVSRRLERTIITAAMLFTVVGILLSIIPAMLPSWRRAERSF